MVPMRKGEGSSWTQLDGFISAASARTAAGPSSAYSCAHVLAALAHALAVSSAFSSLHRRPPSNFARWSAI